MDSYEALLRTRAARSRRVAMAVCIAVAGLSVIALAERPETKKNSIRSAQEQMEAQSAKRIEDARLTIIGAELAARLEQTRFSQVVGATLDVDFGVLGAIAARQELCNVTLPTINTGSWPRTTTGRLHGKASIPLLTVKTTDRGLELPSPSIAALLSDVRRADDHLVAGHYVEAILYADALQVIGLHHDVIVATTKYRRPVRNTPTSYEPGEIEGRAYLYDFGNHRIVCAGDVHAESSRNIEYTYPVNATAPSAQDFSPLLDDDLELQLQRTIATGNVLFKID